MTTGAIASLVIGALGLLAIIWRAHRAGQIEEREAHQNAEIQAAERMAAVQHPADDDAFDDRLRDPERGL